MISTWVQQGSLADFTDDLRAALASNTSARKAPVTRAKPKKTPGSVVKSLLQPVAQPSNAAVIVGSDELIAGARLQWSVSLGLELLDSVRPSLPGTIYAEKTDALRQLIENAGLQSVQVTTSKFDTASAIAGKAYPGVFVVEMTTPINRRQKADLRWDLGQMAQQAGLTVDSNPAHNNLAVMRQGANGTQGGLPNEPYKAPSSGNPDTGLDAFLKGLGLSTPWAMLAGAAIFIAILRR